MRIRFGALGALFIAASCGSPQTPVHRPPAGLEDSIAARVRELHEEDIEFREAAMAALTALGPDALPEIRRAQERIGDGEVLARLKFVIEKLEEQDRLVKLVGRPRLIELHARRLPIEQALQELARQSGVPVVGDGLPPGEVVDVNIRSAPIWDAVDSLCRSRGDLCPEWSTDRVTIRQGPFRETPHVDWKIGPITMGRFWLEYASVVKEYRDEPVLESRARLLLSPGKRVYGALLFLDAAQDSRGQSLCADAEGTLCLQNGNDISADRAVGLEVRLALPDVRIPSENEILNSRGTVYFSLAPGTKRLALIADLTPKVWKYADAERPVSTCLLEVHRTESEVRIEYVVTFPMMTDQYDRIIGPLGVRLLTTGGEPIHPAGLREQNGGGSMGATDWYYEARFRVSSDVSIAGLEVLQPAEPASIRIQYDFPRLTLATR